MLCGFLWWHKRSDLIEFNSVTKAAMATSSIFFEGSLSLLLLVSRVSESCISEAFGPGHGRIFKEVVQLNIFVFL